MSIKIFFMAVPMALAGLASYSQTIGNEMVVGAYIMGIKNDLPDPAYVTHINYAFAHVNETFDGVLFRDGDGLRKVVALKKQSPDLKVLISIGGWGSGRFSEMAADPRKRMSFAEDCARFVEEHGLDGIDIDWEYPTSDAAGISASPDDRANFTLLMRDIRSTIGPDKLLTLASLADARYIEFRDILRYIDYVNVMAYDMGNAHHHHASLYRSEYSGYCTADEAVKYHLAAGVPPSKLVLGMPFYGKGSKEYARYGGRMPKRPQDREIWDDAAKVPLYVDSTGTMLYGFENLRSIAAKCGYAIVHRLRGGMYWEYNSEDGNHEFARTTAEKLKGRKVYTNVLVLYEGSGYHKAMADAVIPWLESQGEANGFQVKTIRGMRNASADFLDGYDVFMQLDYPPYAWSEESKKAFEKYMKDGRGGYIRFHHATFMGEFDGFGMWDWFSDFMGDNRFDNYLESRTEGKVLPEDRKHPVMSGVQRKFVIEDDEWWYTYDRCPRNNPSIHVLASVDEKSYSSRSDIRMGNHPVVWVNTAVPARNVCFQFGHSPKLLENDDFKTMLLNAVEWTSGR